MPSSTSDALSMTAEGGTRYADTDFSSSKLPNDRESGVVSIEPPSPQSRRVIAGRYEVHGLFGMGGMGTVYRVRDRALDEKVALKILHPTLARDADAVARFRHEVRLARRVTHRNVARTFDFGEHGPLAYLTMEAIEGESLSRRIARESVLSVEQALSVGLDVAAGLAAAHAAGVVHLDLKPDNILFGEGERVVITDFGIAVAVEPATGSGSQRRVVGTPAYMAPEQLIGATELDARVDIFALGIVLYEMLTGRLPWDGSTDLEVAKARLHQPARDPRALVPTLPAEIAELLLDALRITPDDRIPSSEVLRARLDKIVNARRSRPTGADADGVLTEARRVYYEFWRTTESIALFERALADRPRDARILAGSALALVRATGMDVDTQAARRSARERAELAVDLAPSVPESHVAIGVTYIHDADTAGAATHLRRALDLAPNHADALEHGARMLLETTRIEDGLSLAHRALEAEPRLQDAMEPVIVRAHALLGDWAAVDLRFRDRPRGGGARLSYWLSRIRLALWRNDPEESRRVRAELAGDDFPQKTFALLYARFLGAESLDGLEEQFLGDRTHSSTCSSRQRTFFQQLAVEVHTLRGNTHRAFDGLDAAVANGLFDIAWLERCPALQPLRELPRFAMIRGEVTRRARVVERTLLRGGLS